MSAWKEGDLVEASKGETVMRGKLWNGCTGGVLIGMTGWSIARLLERDFTVKLIERAPEPLPVGTNDVFEVDNTAQVWVATGYNSYQRPGVRGEWSAAEVLADMDGSTFTRLRFEPMVVAETVERIAAYFADEDMPIAADRVRENFGVTS